MKSEIVLAVLSLAVASSGFDLYDAFLGECRKNSGEAAAEKGMWALHETLSCHNFLIDVAGWDKAFEEAIANGTLDKVASHYCGLVPGLTDCMKKQDKDMDACLTKNQKSQLDNLKTVERSVLDELCVEEGRVLVEFFSKRGLDCVKAEMEDVAECVKKAFGDYDDDAIYVNGSLVIVNEKRCADVDRAAKCGVQVLGRCQNPTPSILLEYMRQVVEKRLRCK